MSAAVPDGVLRAITEDGAFRVITVRTTETVRGVLLAQKAEGVNATILADLMTAAVLVRESMAPDLRVQCILEGADKRVRIVADAHPDGMSRGLLQRAAATSEIQLGEGALLQVARTLHNGALSQGVVSVPDHGGISAAIMQYMQVSEQVATMCAVGAQIEHGRVLAAGGYLVQLLPEVLDHKGALMVMTERLKEFVSMAPVFEKGDGAPDKLMAELLYGMAHGIVGDGALHFGCRCGPERIALALSTLPRGDIESFIAKQEPIELDCEYCGRHFVFQPAQLQGLLDAN